MLEQAEVARNLKSSPDTHTHNGSLSLAEAHLLKVAKPLKIVPPAGAQVCNPMKQEGIFHSNHNVEPFPSEDLGRVSIASFRF